MLMKYSKAWTIDTILGSIYVYNNARPFTTYALPFAYCRYKYSNYNRQDFARFLS